MKIYDAVEQAASELRKKDAPQPTPVKV
jgi:hypothetical protein